MHECCNGRRIRKSHASRFTRWQLTDLIHLFVHDYHGLPDFLIQRVLDFSDPTPIFAADGSFKGAINLLLDVTEEQSFALQEQASRCRRLAGATYDRKTSKVLDDMAEGFDRTAERLAVKATA